MSQADTNAPVSRPRNAPPPSPQSDEARSSPEFAATAAAAARPTLGLVVFGRDAAGKRRAAHFPAEASAGAERAAGLMGLQVLHLTNPEQAQRAAKLPRGRLFASGRALVPLVKDAVLDAVFTPDDVSTDNQDAVATLGGLVEPDTGEPARTRDAITVGSLVLVGEAHPLCGWYEAVVVAAPGDDLFALRWRDWPEDPLVARRRDDLALLPPGSIAALGGLSGRGVR